MIIAYVFLAFIFFPMFIRSFISNYEHYSIFHWLECLTLCAGLLFWILLSARNKFDFISIKIWILNHKVLLGTICIIFVLSLEQVTRGIRWDSIQYYAYIARLKDFTFNPNDLLMFKASGHSCYGYVLLYSIGESFSPGNGYGVRIESILFFIISIIILYKILEEIMPMGQKKWRDISVAIYAVTPVILGPIQNIDVEILVLTLFIILFYCYIKQSYIIFILVAVFFVFTKETCVLLLGGFFFYECLYGLYVWIKKKNIINYFKENYTKFIVLYFPLLIFVLYFSSDVTWGSSKVSDSVDKFNYWGVNSVVIINKLEQLFIMNFAWIPTILIAITFITALLKKKLNKSKPLHKITKVLIVCYIIFLSTQLFYVTYVFPRYIMLQYFFLACMMQWALNQNVIKNSYKLIVSSITLVATLIQNFYSLDFITKSIFDTMDIGKTVMTVNSPIIYLNNSTVLTEEEAKFLELSPYADMNRQWSYFDVLINKFLNTIQYSEGDLVLYPDTFYPRSSNIFFGLGSDTYYSEESHGLRQNIISAVDDIGTDSVKYNAKIVTDFDMDFDQYNNVYYLEFPFDTVQKEKFLQNYDVVNTYQISYRGWKLTAYKIRK